MKPSQIAQRPGRATRKRPQRVKVDWSGSTQFKVPIPKDEKERLADLYQYQVLDTPGEEDFDNITTLASHICNTPIALVTLVDSKRQWFKSKVGVTISETSRDVALCVHAIMQTDLLIVRDASTDKRFARNPLVTSNPKIRFYAGAPLVSPDNHALGTLCVIDRVPRVLTRDQTQALRALSRQVMMQLETRRKIIELKQRLLERRRMEKNLLRAMKSLESGNRGKEEYLLKVRHEVRATVGGIIEMAGQLLAGALTPQQREYAEAVNSSARSLLELANDASNSSKVQDPGDRRRRAV